MRISTYTKVIAAIFYFLEFIFTFVSLYYERFCISYYHHYPKLISKQNFKNDFYYKTIKWKILYCSISHFFHSFFSHLSVYLSAQAVAFIIWLGYYAMLEFIFQHGFKMLHSYEIKSKNAIMARVILFIFSKECLITL